LIEESWVNLPAGRMRYLKAGTGRPLILVHGLMGYSFSWRFTMPTLAPHATVYAIDNLGAGLSPAVDGMDCTVRSTAERVLQFANTLELGEFDLLGTSHGGAVAMIAAAIAAEKEHANVPQVRAHSLSANQGGPPLSSEQEGSRIRRLILVAPVNPWSAHGKWLAPLLVTPLGTLIFRNTIERWRVLDHIWLRRLFSGASRIPSDSLAGYRIPVFQNHGFRHASNILKTWLADLADLEAMLPKIRDYPTLLIWGTKDRAVDFASAERLRRNFRNARLVAFEGVGHLPYEECPQEFNRVLIEFLTK
jgi:pimeloyl-ACP methyl ester carboxylesterase